MRDSMTVKWIFWGLFDLEFYLMRFVEKKILDKILDNFTAVWVVHVS